MKKSVPINAPVLDFAIRKSGMKERELCKKIGFGATAISDIRLRGTTSPERIIRIAKALGENPGTFIASEPITLRKIREHERAPQAREIVAREAREERTLSFVETQLSFVDIEQIQPNDIEVLRDTIAQLEHDLSELVFRFNRMIANAKKERGAS